MQGPPLVHDAGTRPADQLPRISEWISWEHVSMSKAIVVVEVIGWQAWQ